MVTNVTTVEGVFLARTAEAYGPFIGRDGREVSGVKYRLYVSQGVAVAPLEVTLTEAQYAGVQGWEFGQVMHLTCELRARSNRIVHQLVSLHDGSAAGG